MSDSLVKDTYFVGVDGGGSKCRAQLASATGDHIGCGLGGPANPLHGIDRTKKSIVEAVVQALQEAGLGKQNLSQVVAGVGLAGVNLPGLFQVMNRWNHPFKSLYLTTDLHIACLGANGRGDGAVIVVGTGSCGYCAIDQRSFIFGGHGFMLGDKGSGAWLGLEAVKALLLAHDNLGPKTLLTELITEKLGQKPLHLIESLTDASSFDYAKLAPLVFAAAKKKDTVAVNILKEGSGYIEALARKLLTLNPPRLSMIGGISPLLMDWLGEDIIEKISPPLNQPEIGALYFSRSQHSNLSPNKTVIKEVN